ncbi:MAG: hypothetical protein V7K86_08685 [Nostoc sp.]|uniref:hypothetical protein n=1 Tax=Nostoc sp. TaxID=1180 RepID=UPI002FF519D3
MMSNWSNCKAITSGIISAIAPSFKRSPQSSEEKRVIAIKWAGTPYHLYYLFSSTLLASCGVRAASPRVAMTERCELAALVLLQRWINNWRFVAVLFC